MPEMKIIAHIHTDFESKFGVPRQSGLVEELRGEIIFEKEYRNIDALRGIEEFSHLWLIWYFSESERLSWSPTVRPPRLGGEKRIGVFATRSPFRPNAIGLSSVRLISVEVRKDVGPVLIVGGADLMDGTPIFDIKPYLAYADSHSDARCGFTDTVGARHLDVRFPEELGSRIPEEKLQALVKVLAEDPRPRYQDDTDRVYGMGFAGFNIRFRAEDGCIIVVDVEKE